MSAQSKNGQACPLHCNSRASSPRLLRKLNVNTNGDFQTLKP
jgi:hypothetical protein